MSRHISVGEYVFHECEGLSWEGLPEETKARIDARDVASMAYTRLTGTVVSIEMSFSSDILGLPGPDPEEGN